MAPPTNMLVQGQDLNTIFAPLSTTPSAATVNSGYFIVSNSGPFSGVLDIYYNLNDTNTSHATSPDYGLFYNNESATNLVSLVNGDSTIGCYFSIAKKGTYTLQMSVINTAVMIYDDAYDFRLRFISSNTDAWEITEDTNTFNFDKYDHVACNGNSANGGSGVQSITNDNLIRVYRNQNTPDYGYYVYNMVFKSTDSGVMYPAMYSVSITFSTPEDNYKLFPQYYIIGADTSPSGPSYNYTGKWILTKID